MIVRDSSNSLPYRSFPRQTASGFSQASELINILIVDLLGYYLLVYQVKNTRRQGKKYYETGSVPFLKMTDQQR
jgi:hypothetical protein